MRPRSKMNMASNYGSQCSAAALESIYFRILLAGSLRGVVRRLSVAVEAARCGGDGGDDDSIGFGGGGSQLAAATMARGSQLADLGSRRWKRRLAASTIRSVILIGGVRKSTVVKNKMYELKIILLYFKVSAEAARNSRRRRWLTACSLRISDQGGGRGGLRRRRFVAPF